MLIQHVSSEGAGVIGTVLDAAGIEFTVYRTDLGEPLPPSRAVRTLGGLVIMGGPMSVHDDRDHPWLLGERDLIGAAVDEGLTVLGVCLGAQQLAAALGGRVMAGPASEIGPGQVMLTPEGIDDPVLGPAGQSFPCMHWHSDTFTVPDGGVRLAGNARYANQAFRMGEKAYGLQFHVEVDVGLAKSWAPLLPEGISLPEEIRQQIEEVGTGVIERLVSLSDR
jgi:GMP synthase (glutamine-hydrolysing)